MNNILSTSDRFAMIKKHRERKEIRDRDRRIVIYPTYSTYLIIQKFGKDLSGIIFSYMFQCALCKTLFTGASYSCIVCSPNRTMCRFCLDIKTLAKNV